MKNKILFVNINNKSILLSLEDNKPLILLQLKILIEDDSDHTFIYKS